MTRTWNTRATSVRSALFLLLGVCVGGFVGMVYGGVGLWEAGPGCACCEVCIIRAFQDHPKSYVEWAITQIPPVSRAIRDPQCS